MRWSALFVVLLVPSSVEAQGPSPACAVPTFAAGVSLRVSDGPDALAAADLDGTGSIDLVMGRQGGRLSFMMNAGDGTFGPPATTVPIGDQVQLLMPADVNQDGNVDLVGITANLTGASAVFVLIGDGIGGFSLSTTIPGIEPKAIAIGDFNGDAHVDLVRGAGPFRAVQLHAGDGAGGFGPAVTISTAVSVSSEGLVARDFNHDGHLDLGIAGSGSTGGAVDIRLGNGDGTFGPSAVVPLGAPPIGSTAGDFNADGHLDLVSPSAITAEIFLLAGDGTGAFGPPAVVATSDRPFRIRNGDFTGDTFLDLALTTRKQETLPSGRFIEHDMVDVLPGNGNGGFGDPVRLPVYGGRGQIATGDFDGDGRLDLAATNNDEDARVFVFRNMCGRIVDIAAALHVSAKPLVVDRPVEYTIAVENRGPDTAYALAVDIDVTGTVLRPVSLTPADGCQQIVERERYRCVIGDVAPGATGTVTLLVSPQEIGTATVAVRAYSGGVDPTPDDHVASDTAPVRILGGERVFLTAPAAGGAVISWSGGEAQSGYYVVRRVGSTSTVFPAVGTPLSAATTSFTDPAPVPGNTNCYVVVPLNAAGEFLGRSDMVCLAPATASTSGAPSNPTIGEFAVREGRNAVHLRWDAVAGANGYIVRTFAADGQKYWQSATSTSALPFVFGASSCYVVFAMNGETPIGNSDTLCAVADVGNIPR